MLAEALTQTGRAAEAVDLLVPLADGGRLSRDQNFKLTRMLLFTGRLDEAQSRARALLQTHGESPTLWERIAQTKRFDPGDPDLDRMRKVFDRGTPAQPAAMAAIATALAKAHIDLGDDVAAERYLEAKAAANRARFPFDPRPYEYGKLDVVAWCQSGEEDGSTVAWEGSGRPVFILGPMRSGTSLLDQIFSRHREIRGGGELKHFWLAARELEDCSSTRIRAIEEKSASVGAGPDPWREFGRRYLSLADERFGAGARFTDKLLSNVYRVRAIHRALPDAHFISIDRSPLDVAWSCWRAQFDAESAWSNSPEGIALYLACHGQIMKAWQSRYPAAMTEVSYEKLAASPDQEIPRVLQACGLADDPATREPQLSKRAVITMSYAQVRAPINTGSIDLAASFPLATRKLRSALGTNRTFPMSADQRASAPPDSNGLTLAKVAVHRGDGLAALGILRGMIAEPPLLGERWAEVVMLCRELLDDDAALAAARRLRAVIPAGTATAFILARALEETGRPAEAVSVLEPVVREGNLSLADLFSLSRMLMYAGKLDQARVLAKRLLQEEPGNPFLWERMAQIRKFTAGDPDIARLEQLQVELARAAPRPRASGAWALAKAYVDIGDDAAAARMLGEAAAARRQAVKMKLESFAESAAASLEALPLEELRQHRPGGNAESRVMFILGPQRSGTTLVQQILGRHPAIAGGGELKFLGLMKHALGDFTKQPIADFVRRIQRIRPGDRFVGRNPPLVLLVGGRAFRQRRAIRGQAAQQSPEARGHPARISRRTHHPLPARSTGCRLVLLARRFQRAVLVEF